MTDQTDHRSSSGPAVRSAVTAPVTVQQRFTAEEVSRRNARIVTDALTDAGLPHVEVGCPTSLRRVVGLEAAGLAAAATAVAATGLWAVAPGGTEVEAAQAVASLDDPGGPRRVWVFDPVADPTGNLVLGPDVACELQAWSRHADRLEAPRQTAFGRWLPADVLDVGVGELPAPLDEVAFPIDAVYTWVDDADPTWVAQRDQALIAAGRASTHASNLADARFRNRDELRYSLRTLAMFAPYVRHVYLVTADQVPSWLDTACPRITVVPHREIFADPSNLPTFNSHAIEAHLHRIEGLAEHYLYLNDDVLFGRPTRAEQFFHANGITRHVTSQARIPPGPATADDIGVDAAAKNGRRLLEQHFGVRATSKFKHVPQPQRRSVVAELVERFSEEVAATAASRFRHPEDLSLPSSLIHHYGYLTGTSVPGRLRYDYIGLDDLERAEERFAELLLRRDRDTICINDAHVPAHEVERADRLVAAFLERFAPVPSEFELDA